MSDRTKSDRKSFVFSDEASARLESLREACRLPTSSLVLRLALLVLEDTVRQVAAGMIVFKDATGAVTRNYHPLMTTGRDARIPTSGGAERKSFVFDEAAAARLEQLRETCRQSTASNVIRLALVVLEDMIEQVRNGGKIEFVGLTGVAKPYHPLLVLAPEPTQKSAPESFERTQANA